MTPVNHVLVDRVPVVQVATWTPTLVNACLRHRSAGWSPALLLSISASGAFTLIQVGDDRRGPEDFAIMTAERTSYRLLAEHRPEVTDLMGLVHRIVPVRMSPDDLDRQRAHFIEHTLPENLLCAGGFVGTRFMASEQTGFGLVSTLWTAMAATLEVDRLAPQRRRRGTGRGITIGSPEYETVIVGSSGSVD